MAIQTATERKSLATKYGTDAAWGALYSAAGSGTAGTEPSGGSPSYARKALSWTGPVTSGSTEVMTATATFDIPSGFTVAGFGFHTAVTAGTYLDGGSLTSQAFASQGTYTATFTYTQS